MAFQIYFEKLLFFLEVYVFFLTKKNKTYGFEMKKRDFII